MCHFVQTKTKLTFIFIVEKAPKVCLLAYCKLMLWTFFSGTRTVPNNILQISRGSTKVIQSATDAKRPNHKLL